MPDLSPRPPLPWITYEESAPRGGMWDQQTLDMRLRLILAPQEDLSNLVRAVREVAGSQAADVVNSWLTAHIWDVYSKMEDYNDIDQAGNRKLEGTRRRYVRRAMLDQIQDGLNELLLIALETQHPGKFMAEEELLKIRSEAEARLLQGIPPTERNR